MIQTTIIPEKTDVNFSFPKNFIGKKVHAIFYIEDEIIEMPKAITLKKPSDFFGILNEDEANKFEKHTKQLRDEWERNI